MVVAAKINFVGLVELQNIFSKMIQQIKDKIQIALKKIGWLITKEIKKNTPVRTARLRRSIHPIFRELVVEILTTVYYSIYVEEGTKFMQGVHMFKNTLDKMSNDIPDMLLKEIKDI